MPAYQRPGLNAVAGLLARLQAAKPRPSLAKLACGIEYLLDHAISQHRRATQGALPKRIELHPNLEPHLLAALGPQPWPRPDRLMHRGVLVLFTARASAPRLITWRNEIDYL